MNDYMLFFKDKLSTQGNWGKRWDVFISAYNSSQRVKLIADLVEAVERYWLILPEYGYRSEELPSNGKIFQRVATSEAEFISHFIDELSPLAGKRIVIDISGLVNHYVLALMALLARAGVHECDVIYGEPARYLHSERTKFSDEAVLSVRQVGGFEGVHTPNTNDDLLVMAVGYDHRLVAEVANDKEHARKMQLFGLPSLRPDMYQENLLSASIVSEAVGPEASDPHHFRYAPAYDPFVTAAVVSSIVANHNRDYPGSNVYLSPLSTKAQALGFAVFYLKEGQNTATSILFPVCQRYMQETSEGLSGIWLYHVEFGALISAN